MNNQSNQLAQPSTPTTKHNFSQRLTSALMVGGLGVSIAYGYKKAGFVGSYLGAILYFGLLVTLRRRT